MNLASRFGTRIGKLEERIGLPSDAIFQLNDWVDCYITPEVDTAPLEAIALDRLVASGKIRDEDRDRVSWIVRVLINPPERDLTV